MPRAFRNTVWKPGQPLDPTATQLGPKETTDRLLYLEQQLANFDVDNLDIGTLKTKLEQSWLPDPQTLFAPGTIGFDSLVFSIAMGRVGSTGTVLRQVGPIAWTVVRNGLGDYTVTFPELSGIPVALALPVSSVTGLRVTSLTNKTAQFVMSVDSDFDFILIGK